MPLAETSGDDDSFNISRLCGVETDFMADMPHLFSRHIHEGFDFVLAPLMDPSYRPSLMEISNDRPVVLPFVGSEFLLSPSQWSKQVIGKLSTWIDLDSEGDKLRYNSEITLRQEIAWASHLSLKACVLPTPKRVSCANYARFVKEILHNLKGMQLWLRIPLVKFDEDARDAEGLVDSWEMWNSFRLICEHHNQLSIVLDVSNNLPSINSIDRWFGEPVCAAIIHTDSFKTNAKGPFLSRKLQILVTSFFHHSIQVNHHSTYTSTLVTNFIISGLNDRKKTASDLCANETNNFDHDPLRHPLRSYLDYFAYIYRRMVPLSGLELSKIGFRDVLHGPMQPFMDNVDTDILKTSEIDTARYTQYRRAILKALSERISNEEASTVTLVIVIVGPGRGPILTTTLEAAVLSDRKVKVYAVEKNPNTFVYWHNWVLSENLEDIVTVVYSDIRVWEAPEKADILVSDLLGPFGDDLLSPEYLNGAEELLKDDGISIPSSYTSFIEPVTSTKLFNDARSLNNLAHLETRYSVKLYRVASLAPSEPVFTFCHPKTTTNNERHAKIQFKIPHDNGSVLVHGLAGYFDAVLYKNIHLSTEPSRATPDLSSWYPAFFPLRKPVYVALGSPLEVQFWRRCEPTKVWYEWCVTLPTMSSMHNTSGRSYSIDL
ncbi:protein arginine N-methyltransferase 1.5-like [Impatiens glandulifera]|uniref:protein arginine N-methyltransferase 1.5-like n=1 Tax=Impatiens glandulifera TaxID=253017 RepID=UPI001FB125F5|nr:protein arginine N-methyltransferase 1.5-like [Impatiens glandulifera]